MVHGQLVYFDRDPSLWLTLTTPGASHRSTAPALLATLVVVGLATIGLFISNRPRDGKCDRKSHATPFNILARVTIFAALSYLIYTTIPGLLIYLSTAPIRTLAKPAPLHVSLASRLYKPIITLLDNIKVLNQHVLRPSPAIANDSPFVVSAQRFVSWLLENDRLATYYPTLMAISMGHKAASSFLSSAARARPSFCITHKAVLLVLTLGFTATVQSVAVLARVSALKHAALVAPGFAVTLCLDMLASLPSLAVRYVYDESKWQTATEYATGAVIMELFLYYTKNFYNLRSYANILLGDPTTGKLDSVTTQAVAFGVLLFPCLVASQIHSTISIIRLLHSQSPASTPATTQPNDGQESIGKKEQPVANLTSIDTVKKASTGQVLPADEDRTPTTTSTPKSRFDYGTMIRTHPSALHCKIANVYAWITNPNLRYRSIDGWEYTFNDSDLYDVYLLMAKAYKRVLDEILKSVPTVFESKTIDALVVKYMQEARKDLLHSHPSVSGGRGMNHRRTEYHRRQQAKNQRTTHLPTPPLSSSESDLSDHSEPTTPPGETREAAVQLKTGSLALGNKIKAAMANPVKRQVQCSQMKPKTYLPPVAELDEEVNAAED